MRSLPRDLEAICLKTLNKDRHKRYASATELRDDLECWRRQQPVSARPGLAHRVELWSRRSPDWAAVIALAILAFVAASVGVIHMNETRADAALAVANAETDKRHEAEARAAAERREAEAQRHEAQAQHREVLLQQIQRIRLTYQRQGWWRDDWDFVPRLLPSSVIPGCEPRLPPLWPASTRS